MSNPAPSPHSSRIAAACRVRFCECERLRASVLAIALVGCGRFHFDARDDAGGPADNGSPPADACTFGPWSTPVELTSLSSTATEFGGWISPDKLEILFSSSRTGIGRIYRSRRASLADPFGAPALVDMGLTASQDDPFVTDDGLTMYFDASPVSASHLYVATRAVTSVEFANPVELTQLNSANIDAAPAVTSDDLTLFFNSDRATVGDVDLYVATRARVTDAFGAPMPIAELTRTGVDAAPSPSSGGQTLVFASDQFTTGLERLVQTTRAGAGFGAPTLLDPALSVSGAMDTDPTLSRDGTTLVFSSDRPGGTGGFDLYIATRSCQ